MTNPLAFQDEIPDNHCWGCGSRNPYGLRIKSHWSGEEAVCSWQPEEHHAVGPKHILNGGIIATLIDCHCICTATSATYRAEGREMNSPTPDMARNRILDGLVSPPRAEEPVRPVARKDYGDEAEKPILRCSLSAGEEECAAGEVVAVRVPPEWREKG